MTQPHRAMGLCGLLTLVLLAGCDSGPPKDAGPSKTAATKTDAKKGGPAKADVKAEAKTPAPTPAPAPVVTPEPAPPEPAPTTAVEPGADDLVPPVDPAADDAGGTDDAGATDDGAADDGAADDGAADDGAADDEADPAAAGGDGSSPISMGPDAELLKLVLAHDVVNRQPVDPATTFPVGQKVSLFIEARNETGEDIRIKVTWEDTKSGRRSPPVGVVIAPRKLHRTRSYRTMRKAGEYRAIVLSDDDGELASLPFTIE